MPVVSARKSVAAKPGGPKPSRATVEKAALANSEGERRAVTIMFADISGFTALAETCDAEEVRNIINDCFEAIAPIIERYGGIVDKFIGDCIMALFGARIAHEDNPERALLASLEMLATFQQFAKARKLNLDIHFGINTGVVVAGNLGFSGRQDFSVIGDAVNLAARLEDLSEPGEILVGSATHRQAESTFDFERRGDVLIKGKQVPVPVFKLIARKFAPITDVRLRGPLVGRDAELAVLERAIASAVAGRGSFIDIVGDAGVGKSRLIAEAHAVGSSAKWIEVRCQSHRQSIGFGLARALLLKLLDCASNDDPEMVRSHVRDASARAGGDKEARASRFAYLATIAGLPGDAEILPYIEPISPAALMSRFARSLWTLLEALAAEQPLAIVWEDLHWGDSSSIELLSVLAKLPAIPFCLFIATRRPDHEAAGGGGFAPTRIDLEPLSQAESLQLLSSLAGRDRRSQQLFRTIAARAEGNPFFLEELVQSLIDQGSIRIEDGKMTLVENCTVSGLPLTLQGVMMARLDRLSAGGKETLQTASVIGRMFDAGLLGHVLRERPTVQLELGDHLRSLHSRDFIRPRDRKHRVYRFRHGVTREVAYESLLLSKRRALHGTIADALRFVAGDPVPIASILADHYASAGRLVEAAEFLFLSAMGSRRTYANAEALAAYRRVIGFKGSLLHDAAGREQLLEAYERAVELLIIGGQQGAALTTCNEALDHLEAMEPIHRAAFLRRSGQARILDRQAEDAARYYAQALAALGAPPADDDRKWWNEWIEIQLERLWSLYWLGRTDLMREIVSAAEGPVALQGSIGQKARLLDRHLLIRIQKEDSLISPETVNLARQALGVAESWGDPTGLAVAHHTLGFSLLWTEGKEEAVLQFGKSLHYAERIGNAEYEVISRANRGIAYRFLNDVENAARDSEAALKAATASDMRMYAEVASATLAWVARRKGDLQTALRLAQGAVDFWAEERFRVQLLALWPLLELAALRAEQPIVLQCASALRAKGQYRLPIELESLVDRALAANDCGDQPATEVALDQALQLAASMGYI